MESTRGIRLCQPYSSEPTRSNRPEKAVTIKNKARMEFADDFHLRALIAHSPATRNNFFTERK
jgi:hypothetical protein